MNERTLKALITIILMMALVPMAFTTQELMESMLCASFGIIVGVITSQHLTNQNMKCYDKK